MNVIQINLFELEISKETGFSCNLTKSFSIFIDAMRIFRISLGMCIKDREISKPSNQYLAFQNRFSCFNMHQLEVKLFKEN